jgi:hypothetical protein
LIEPDWSLFALGWPERAAGLELLAQERAA